jgi:hypothetical protein
MMLLYAQHGYAPGDKLLRAVEERFINGVILSPRYLSPETANRIITDLRGVRTDLDVLFDPEFYATINIGTPNAHLGSLEQWPYFQLIRRNDLLVGTASIDDTLRLAYQAQKDLNCSAIIAPNIYIGGSFDSIDSAIAISFITRAKSVAEDMGIREPLYVTLAICKDALINRHECINFINLLTSLDTPPDGMYTLVGAGPTDARSGVNRSEILVPEVLGGWMLLNHALSINGLRVMNGCSDIFSPLLGIAQGVAGATGWWSNLQVFSMGKYIKGPRGGQQPLIRYLSKRLMNRITLTERETFSEILPEVMNGLSTDTFYIGQEPTRTEEALQGWQSLSTLTNDLVSGDINEDLVGLGEHIVRAKEAYTELQSHGFSQKYETNIDYLTILERTINYFREVAEI